MLTNLLRISSLVALALTLAACPGPKPSDDAGTDGGTDGGNKNDAGPTFSSCDAEKVIDFNTNPNVDKDTVIFGYAGTVAGSVNRIDPPNGCQASGGGGLEVVHKLTTPVKADIIAVTHPTTPLQQGEIGHDSVLYMLNSCSTGAAPSGTVCNDDDGAAAQSAIFVENVNAGTYYFVVDSAAADTTPQDYELRMQVTPIKANAASCDPSSVFSRCDTGLVCRGAEGSEACRAPTGAAPVLTDAGYFNLGAGEVSMVINGTDVNSDVAGFVVELLDVSGNPIPLQGGVTEVELPFTPTVDGQAAFMGSFKVNLGANLPPAVRVRLKDKENHESPKATAVLTNSVKAATNACDPNVVLNRCDVSASLVCGAGSTCVAGSAPGLSNLRAQVMPDGSRQIVATVPDTDNDFSRMLVTFRNASDAGVPIFDVNNDQQLTAADLTAPLRFDRISGTTGSLTLSANIFSAGAGAAITKVEVQAQDALSLNSAAQSAAFVAIPTAAAGATCDPMRWNNICTDPAAPACPSTGSVCTSRDTLATQKCGAVTAITANGNGVTGELEAGPNIWDPHPMCAVGTFGSEDVYSFVNSQVQDLIFTTDFPDTDADTIISYADGCSVAPGYTAATCNDDVDFDNGNYKSWGVILNAPVKTYYFFIDSYQLGDFSTGQKYRFKVLTRAIVSTAGGDCDPKGEKTRCANGLSCQLKADWSGYSCQ